ncbi:ABC transporter permease subunit [Blautia schinkii]|nr:ABC transporter permease subunit [Blautia schinkii]
MTLYKMELYRILHRKIVWILFGVMLVWLAAFFGLEGIAGEHSKVEGKVFYGYDAIQADREITEEYKGILTDIEVGSIIEKYGFPDEVKEDYGSWMDENYLNGFVTEYCSDGYFAGWDDYKVAQNIQPLEKSALGSYVEKGEDGVEKNRDGVEKGGDGMEKNRDGVEFAYVKGWEKFLEMSQMAGWFLSVWLIITLAPLFCEEKQNRMRPLIFTTDKGRSTDITARISAAFTVAASSYLLVTALLFLLCGAVFGFDGATMKTGIVMQMREFYSMSHWNISSFVGLYIFTAFCAILMLTGVIVFVSSKADTTVRSMLSAALIWGLPIVLLFTFSGRVIYLLAIFQPVLLTNYTCLMETNSIYFTRISVAVAAAIIGAYSSFRGWKQIDRE